MKNISLIIISMFFLAACANSQTQQKPSVENVDALKFKQLVEAKKGIVIDVRTPEEFSEGYIPTATNIDIYNDDFETRVTKLDKSKEIYVYCQAGGRSSDAAKILQNKGYKVYNLEDGFSDWKKKGFPVMQQ
jgi:phage shock protein E